MTIDAILFLIVLLTSIISGVLGFGEGDYCFLLYLYLPPSIIITRIENDYWCVFRLLIVAGLLRKPSLTASFCFSMTYFVAYLCSIALRNNYFLMPPRQQNTADKQNTASHHNGWA